MIRRRPLPLLLAALATAACGGPAPVAPTPPRAPAVEPLLCPQKVAAPPEEPSRAEALAGKKIARVCILGAVTTERAVKNAISSSEGDPLELDRIRRDVGALMQLGALEVVTVAAEPRGDAVVLVYEVQERPILGAIEFAGNHAVDGNKLASRASLEQGRPFVIAHAKLLARVMRDEYVRLGYGGATVDYEAYWSKPGEVHVRYYVVEGPQWKLRQILFEGAARVRAGELLDAAHLTPGSAYDPDEVERALMRLVGLYHDRGMVTVNVGEPKPTVTAEGAVTLAVPIQEGEVFRIGRVRFAKHAEKSEKALLPKIKSRPKQVFSRSRLAEDVSAVEAHFKERGEPVDVSGLTQVDEKTRTIEIVLEASPAAPR